MPTREDVLRDKTHKGGTDTLGQRVYYTLHADGNRDLQLHRNTKAIELLISYLHKQRLLDDDGIDDILLEVVSS